MAYHIQHIVYAGILHAFRSWCYGRRMYASVVRSALLCSKLKGRNDVIVFLHFVR